MKKLELNQMENQTGGDFWGWSEWSNGPCVNGVYSRARVYSVIWFSVDFEQQDNLPC
jgi:hypothetical protein